MSKRILIVEDEESIADLEKDYLELSGFEVEVANDGEIGLKKGLEGEFDLIILDLMLPEVDGFDICRQVREEKNTPIIMVSAKKDDIDKIRGLGLGAHLINCLLGYLDEINIDKIILHVTKSNIPAFRLYQSMGFVVDSSLDYYCLNL